MKKLLYILICILPVSCRQDLSFEGDCIILPDNAYVIYPGSIFQPEGYDPIYTLEDSGSYFSHPHFNPNNSDEFIYRTEQGIRMHRLSDGYDQLVYAGILWHPAYWGKSGLIVFNSGYKIYTVKPDGSEVKLRSESGPHADVFWNYSGSKIIFSNGASDDHSYCIDTSGNFLFMLPDEIRLYYLDHSLDENVVLYPQNDAVWQNDSLFENPSKLMNLVPAELYGFASLSPTKIIWTDYESLYIADHVEQSYMVLKQGCFGAGYKTFAISPNKQKIIVSMDRVRYKGEGMFIRYTELHIMNADGSNEQVIDLPQ